MHAHEEAGTRPVKWLVSIGSGIMIAFGVWHFFVPGIWDWYAHIDADATELVIAVRAINVFFSLLMVLLGLANLLLTFRERQDRYSLAVLLSVSTVLWAVRCILQVIHPQGSQQPGLALGMLLTFVFVFACFAGALGLTIVRRATRST
ncbi:MAG: hypothetical protein KIT10_07015 [Flavobacteriales bacterium]|nr:hypothetical protein [Flavobacteriales bacterium]